MTNLTPSLEDYLETIFLLQKGSRQEARVRDIAAARNVKASSVSPALKRLAEMGYLEYEQRESIRLTDAGKIAAQRVYARHVLLFQFFHDILGMPEERAREEACGLEHALSDEGMDRFVRFFESRSLCPNCAATCASHGRASSLSCDACQIRPELKTLDAVTDSHAVTVIRIDTDGPERQAILDMGILPNIRLVKRMTTSTGVILELNSHDVTLSHYQCQFIIVTD